MSVFHSENNNIFKNQIINVLFVDDNESFLEIAKFYLEKTNNKIHAEITTSPKYVLDTLRTKQFDIIISDYLMSEISGLTLLEEVRKHDQEIPFIILTGQGREEVVIQALNLGANYYLQKGIDPNALFAELNNFVVNSIEKRQALRAQKQVEKNLLKQNEETTLYLEIITHDLNGYHMAAKTFLELFLGKFILPEDNKTIIQKSIKNIIRANTLLNTVSILMQQDLPLDYELHPINVLFSIERIKKDLFSLYPKKSIILETGTIPTKITIQADLLFDQLLLNLFTNAVKNDPNLTVRILTSIEVKDEICLLKISDYGCGIAPDKRKNLFNQRSQIRRTVEGMGVGLRIVKALIDRYQGEIWLEDRVLGDYTRGTRFTLKLHLSK